MKIGHIHRVIAIAMVVTTSLCTLNSYITTYAATVTEKKAQNNIAKVEILAAQLVNCPGIVTWNEELEKRLKGSEENLKSFAKLSTQCNTTQKKIREIAGDYIKNVVPRAQQMKIEIKEGYGTEGLKMVASMIQAVEQKNETKLNTYIENLKILTQKEICKMQDVVQVQQKFKDEIAQNDRQLQGAVKQLQSPQYEATLSFFQTQANLIPIKMDEKEIQTYNVKLSQLQKEIDDINKKYLYAPNELVKLYKTEKMREQCPEWEQDKLKIAEKIKQREQLMQDRKKVRNHLYAITSLKQRTKNLLDALDQSVNNTTQLLNDLTEIENKLQATDFMIPTESELQNMSEFLTDIIHTIQQCIEGIQNYAIQQL